MAQLNLKVRKQAFKNLQSKQTGYISRVISNGVVDFEDLCCEASRNTTLHSKELELAFGLALDAVREALTEGKIVVLDQIGRLYPAVSSKWTEKAEDQKLDTLERRVAFRPNQAILSAINGARLTWATDAESAEAAKKGTTDTSDSQDTGGSSSDTGTDTGGSSSDTGSSSGSLTDDNG